MATKSILEYDEAMRRLQQLQADQASLVQVVTKLRRLSDDAETKLRTIEQHEQLASTHIRETQATATQCQSLLTELQGEAKANVEHFRQSIETGLEQLEQAKARVEAECEETRHRLVAGTEDFKEYLEKHQQEWCSKQAAEYQQFTEHQHAQMEGISKAYEHHRAVLDDVESNTESLRVSLESQARSMQDGIDRLRDHIDSRVKNNTEEWAHRIGAAREELMAAITSQTAAVRSEVSVDTQAVQEQVKLLAAALGESRKRSYLQLCVLLYAITVAVILGGLGTLVTVNQANREQPVTASGEKVRVQTDSKGRTEVGVVVGLDAQEARLFRNDGRLLITVPFEGLRKAYQDIIRQKASGKLLSRPSDRTN